jgi:hypothetical protein
MPAGMVMNRSDAAALRGWAAVVIGVLGGWPSAAWSDEIVVAGRADPPAKLKG